MSEPIIRPFRPGDETGIQSLLMEVYKEFSFTWEPHGYNRDSYEIERFYHEKGGGFWVMELNENIIGTIGLKLISAERCELCRLYLAKSFRGMGYGKALFRYIQTAARILGFIEMEIWSDNRLEVAHMMYQKSGAAPIGERICDDPDNSEEWGFLLDLKREERDF